MPPTDVQRIAIDTRTNRVFVSPTPVEFPDPSSSTVRVLDARSGALLRTVRAGGGSLVVDERAGHVFVVNLASNSVCMLDARSGAILRTVAVGPGAVHLAVSQSTGRVFVKEDAGLLMLDSRTGRALRTIPVARARFAAMAVDEATRRVIATDVSPNPPYNGSVSLVDALSGAIIRIVPLPNPGDVLSDERRGRAFVATTNGIAVLDAHNGRLLRTAAPGMQFSELAVDERSERVFAVDPGVIDSQGILMGPGRVGVLDARSGVLLRTFTVGVYPGPVAVDERTGHAFVVDGGGSVYASDPWGWVPRWLRRWLPILPPPSSARTAPAGVSVLDATR